MNYREVKCSDRLPEKEGWYGIKLDSKCKIESGLFNSEAVFELPEWEDFTGDYENVIWLEPYELPTGNNVGKELLKLIGYDNNSITSTEIWIADELAKLFKPHELPTEEENWVSVKDQLPDRECLCVNKSRDYLIGYLTKRGKDKYWCVTEETALIEVTHWMHLPVPPKP